MLDKIKKELGVNIEPGVFHKIIAEKLKEKMKNRHTLIIKRIEVKFILSRHTISRANHQKFLKEMEGFGLIKLKDKQNIELK